MTDKQPESLKWADAVECAHMPHLAQLIRTQHAAIERKDALLRQALKALEQCWNDDNWRDYEMEDAVAKAIKQELSQ